MLASLPDDTAIYPGHEYTKSNVKFLTRLSPRDEAVQRLSDFADANPVTTGRFTMREEKLHNLFMRVGTEEMRRVTGKVVPSEVLGRLREMKNNM